MNLDGFVGAMRFSHLILLRPDTLLSNRLEKRVVLAGVDLVLDFIVRIICVSLTNAHHDKRGQMGENVRIIFHAASTVLKRLMI